MKKQTAFSALSLLALFSCAHQSPHRLPSGQSALTDKEKEIETYNKLVPYYAQSCVYTEFARRTGKFDDKGKEIIESGGSAGHASMFIKGACIDRSKDLPQLKVCDD